jgi:hypothetical protein
MKVGIVHGACINPNGSLQLHTKARADTAINAYKNSILDIFIVSGKNEAIQISYYMVDKGVNGEKIMVEPFSYSTISNLYYSKPYLSLLGPVERVYLISSYWHIPRLEYVAGRILKKYRMGFIEANDPRNKEEIKKDIKLERFKFMLDKILLNLGYGKGFNERRFLTVTTSTGLKITDLIFSNDYSNEFEKLINFATSSHQKMLMKFERMLYENVFKLKI